MDSEGFGSSFKAQKWISLELTKLGLVGKYLEILWFQSLCTSKICLGRGMRRSSRYAFQKSARLIVGALTKQYF